MSTAQELESQVSQLIEKCLQKRMDAKSIDLSIRDDLQFIQSGLMDSVGFLDFLAEIEDALDVELDFEDMDPEEFLSVAGFKQSVMTALRGSDAER